MSLVIAEMGENKLRSKLLTVAVAVVLATGLFWWAKGASAPKPGQFVAELGREHVPVGTKVQYNSNPPTSGPHYEEWEKAGIYDQPLVDEKMVHSLEHGYVIISYNCSDCQELVTRLSDLAKAQNLWKLIVVPRPNLDSRIALTAWGRIDKFTDFDEERIVKFIKAFRDRGPEKTME